MAAPLDDLALSPHGVFSRANAVAAGVGLGELRRLVRTGAIRRVQRGFYAFAETYDAARLVPERAHGLAAAALVRSLRGDAVISHESAALLQRLDTLSPAPPRPLVTHVAPPGGGGRPREFVAPVPPEHRLTLGSIPLTTAARTVVDIARARGIRDGIVVADSTLRRGATRGDVAQAVDFCSGWPGNRTARRVMELADGRSESPLESLHRLAFEELGLPAPQPQVWVEAAGFQMRVDFLWDRHRTVFESDGLSKYARPEDFRDEKLREERLRDLGFEVVRGDWREAMTDRSALRRKVLAAFARAAERPWPTVLPYTLVFTPLI